MLVSNNSTGKDAWLKGFSKSSKRVYRNGYEKFIEYMKQTEKGDWNDRRLLKEREIDLKERNFAFEQIVVDFYQWLDELPRKPSDNTKKAYMSGICSFFAFHRLNLKFTKPQRNKIWKPAKPVKKYYEFTLEDLRRMNQVANPKERYVLLVSKSLGLRAFDFVGLKQGTFEARLKGEAPVSLGEIFTQKEGVKAYPFLDEDAVEASKTWLQILESKGKRDPEERIINISKQEVDLIIKKLAKRAGINTGNEIVRFHQLRVFLCTRLASVTSESRWKQIVGKRVPESSYVKPFNLREDYAKVLPHTTVREKVAQDEVNKLREEVKELMAEGKSFTYRERTLMDKIDNLEQQLNELREEVKKLTKKKEKGLLEIYGDGEPPSTEITEFPEEIDFSEEESELQ